MGQKNSLQGWIERSGAYVRIMYSVRCHVVPRCSGVGMREGCRSRYSLPEQSFCLPDSCSVLMFCLQDSVQF
jgi:hypothetical protein